MNKTLPPIVRPPVAWRPYHFIGQFGGSLHIDQLPEGDSAAYSVMLAVSRSDTKMTAAEISALTTAYRRTAIMTTACIVNLLTR